MFELFELFGIFEIFISVRIWRTPCKLLAYPQGYAYPRLRIAGLLNLAYTDRIRQQSSTVVEQFYKLENKISLRM